MVCPIFAVPAFLFGISGVGVLQHLPLPYDAVMQQHSCQPFLQPFRLKLNLLCLTELLHAANCLPDLTATGHRALLGAGCREHQLHLVLGALELNSVH